MADNYLEKKFEEYYSNSGKAASLKHTGPSLDSLFTKNRSCRGYIKDYVVKRIQLERIVGVNCKIASAMNRQTLRFRLVTAEDAARNGNESPSVAVLKSIRLGGALPELHLPLPGCEPEAFIIVCSSVPEDRYIDIDLGISAQSMLLKATEMGLNGIMVCAFDKSGIKEALELPYDPLMVIAVGKTAERYELRKVKSGDSLKYFRENGVHVIPKLPLEEILI